LAGFVVTPHNVQRVLSLQESLVQVGLGAGTGAGACWHGLCLPG